MKRLTELWIGVVVNVVMMVQMSLWRGRHVVLALKVARKLAIFPSHCVVAVDDDDVDAVATIVAVVLYNVVKRHVDAADDVRAAAVKLVPVMWPDLFVDEPIKYPLS